MSERSRWKPWPSNRYATIWRNITPSVASSNLQILDCSLRRIHQSHPAARKNDMNLALAGPGTALAPCGRLVKLFLQRNMTWKNFFWKAGQKHRQLQMEKFCGCSMPEAIWRKSRGFLTMLFREPGGK